RLERLARRDEVLFGDEDVEPVVLARLELRLDPGRAEDRLHLLRFGHIARHRDLDLLPHVAGTLSPARSGSAPPLTSAGSPRSANGTSTTSKSRVTTVFGKISRASRTSSGPKERGETCVSARRRTPAPRASSAACRAVE